MEKTKDVFMQMREAEQNEQVATVNNGILPINRQSILELNKEAIKRISSAVVQEVAEGIEDPLRVLIMAKKAIELFTSIEENAKHYVYGHQYEKHSVYGCDIEPAQLGTKFDFSGCADPVLNDLQAKADQAVKDLKDRQNFLKAINGSATLVDTESGETWTAYPPVKTATSGYKISIK